MPEFLHPSVRSRIIDNSIVFVTAQGQTLLYAAFKAERGPDNRPVLMTSDSERSFTYGPPNMRKYGQTSYNVDRWLRSGGIALCTRILPYMDEDESSNPIQPSTYPVMVLEVGTLMDSTVPANPATARKIKVRTRVLGDGGSEATTALQEAVIRDDLTLRTVVLAAPSIPEADDYKYFPVCLFRGKSRGEYFNGHGPRIELMTALDEDYEHRTYEVTMFSSPSKATEGPFVVSFHPEAQDRSGRSLFIADVLNQYSNSVDVLVNEDNLDAVYAYINATAANWKKLDILTLVERTVATPETIHSAVTADAGSADLSPAVGVYIPMGGGTDGAWTGPNSEEALLYKAYSGTGDVIALDGTNTYDTFFSDVLDKDRYPVDMVLDANLPQSVKVALSNLAQTRGDLMAMLDVGFTPSPAAAKAYRVTNLTVSNFFTAIFGQDFVVFDEFQGNDIRVTPTYYLAEKIPLVDNEQGIHWPFVGPRRGAIAGFKSASWFPNASWREQLYAAKVNYVERDARGLVNFGSQSTSQVFNSALSDISHVRALLRIRRDVEALCKDYRFEFNDTQTWGQLQYSLSNYLRQWVSNRALSTVKGTVYASDYDKQQRILRVKIELSFTGLIERIFIDLVVNR